jgi:uncharacterized small protein (DUF1192 family)
MEVITNPPRGRTPISRALDLPGLGWLLRGSPFTFADNAGALHYARPMPLTDEDAPKKKPVHEIGEDLSKLSLFELAERIESLRTEIVRLEQAVQVKKASADRAATFFKK